MLNSTKVQNEHVSAPVDHIFDLIPFPLFIIDLSGLILVANPTAEDLFGVSGERLRERYFKELFPIRFEKEVDHFLNTFVENPKHQRHGEGWELICHDKNDKEFFVRLHIALISDSKDTALLTIKPAEKIEVISNINLPSPFEVAEREIARLSAFQKEILDSSIYSIISTRDPDGIITTFNKGAERMLGYTAEEVVGKTSPAIVHVFEEVVERAKVLSDEFGRTIDPGVDVFHFKARTLGVYDTNEWTYIKKDGTKIQVELAISTIKGKDGSINGYLGIARDITAEKEQQKQVSEHAKLVEAKNIELEQFTYIASHDLQEPLRTISNFGKLLESHESIKNDEVALKYFDFISGATTRMQGLIKCLLDYSRLGKQDRMENINLNNVIENLKVDMMDTFEKTNAELIFEELPTVYGSVTDLRLLFQNLVSNGIKFSNPKAVNPRIIIYAEPVPGFWKFYVTDNGIGIDKKHFNKIFLLFQRLKNGKEIEGHGIGLSHCKKIVENHGGTIEVVSDIGIGSTFIFTIKRIQ